MEVGSRAILMPFCAIILYSFPKNPTKNLVFPKNLCNILQKGGTIYIAILLKTTKYNRKMKLGAF